MASGAMRWFMVDTHAHILPAVDDGAKDWEESLAMARFAFRDGIEDIICTPHYVSGIYENKRRTVVALVENLVSKLKGAGTNVRVHPGAEIRVDQYTPELIFKKVVPTLNDSRYVLLELPYHSIPPAIDEILWRIISRGYVPVLAHPERCRPIWHKPEIVRGWVDRGVLLQVTAASLEGFWGQQIARCAWLLLENGLAHVVATDSHGVNGRLPELSTARDLIAARFGAAWAEMLTKEIPEKILRDELILPQEAGPVDGKKSERKKRGLRNLLTRVLPFQR